MKAIAFGKLALVSTDSRGAGVHDTIMELSGGRWTTIDDAALAAKLLRSKSLRPQVILTRISSHRSLKARRRR